MQVPTIAQAIQQEQQWVGELTAQAQRLRGQLADLRRLLAQTEQDLARHQGALQAFQALQAHVTALEQSQREAPPDD
jgi:ABC-type transporter Mla subunit MlaD